MSDALFSRRVVICSRAGVQPTVRKKLETGLTWTKAKEFPIFTENYYDFASSIEKSNARSVIDLLQELLI